jgi:hypothetical protein
MEKIINLREQLKTKEAELLQVKLTLIESKIANLEQHNADQENRLRVLETSRVRFETLSWLAFGGGGLSLLNLILQILNIRL